MENTMEDIRLAYRQDDFGNDMYCRVTWSKQTFDKPRPIALIYHGGGYVVGSSQMIPKPQIDWLNSHGFICVMPNYRLAPQVDVKQALADCEDAYTWATTALVTQLLDKDGIAVDPTRVVAMGHSSGGVIALHLASLPSYPLRAVTALYPSQYQSDLSGPCFQPFTSPPFGTAPDFNPTEEDWQQIKPTNRQICEAPMQAPGAPPQPRGLYHMNNIKAGKWMSAVQPDGDYAAVDPTTKITSAWPATFVVAGEIDNVPGSSPDLQKRFTEELKSAGVREVELEVVPKAWHMFDMAPDVGTSDVSGPRWQGVLRGLEWLAAHV